MSRHLDPFYSAKLAFGCLHRDIEVLRGRVKAFIKKYNLIPVPERDPDTGELVYKVRIAFDVPDDIERDAVRHLIEIRGALDKAVHGSARILGSRSLNHTNFPFGDAKGGKSAFESQLASERGPWRGIPDEIHPYLLQLAPFPTGNGYAGGNNLLALLGSLSNPAKHQNVLIVSLQVTGISITRADGPLHFPRVQTVWNDARDECEVFRLSPTSGKFEFSIPTQISFNAPGVFARYDFSSVLADMARMGERIVLGIEANTTESLKQRES